MSSDEILPNGETKDTIYFSILKNICKLEAEFNKEQSRILKERIETCDEKLSLIQKGFNCTAEFRKALKTREDAFYSARLFYRYKVNLIEKIYQTELRLADNEFQAECQIIRANLLVEIEDKIQKLKEEKENVDVRSGLGYEIETVARTHSSSRRNRKRGDLEVPKPKKRLHTLTPGVTQLKEDQIMKDLSEMRQKQDS